MDTENTLNNYREPQPECEQKCIEQLELTLEHMDVNDRSNMFVSCIRLMAIAETFQIIPGSRRKELVMTVIQKHLPQNSSHLPTFMDIIIDVEKGKMSVSIPQTTQEVSGCLELILKACLPSKK